MHATLHRLSFDKVKRVNEREERALSQTLRHLSRERTEILNSQLKERCSLTRELRAHQSLQIQNRVKEKTKTPYVDSGPVRLTTTTACRSLFYKRGVKGSRPKHVLDKSWISHRADSDSDVEKEEEVDEYSGDPVVVYDPSLNGLCLIDACRRKHPLTKLKSPRGQPEKGTGSSIEKKDMPRVASANGGHRWPSYVEAVQDLISAAADDTSDGTMSLQLRRFKQLQRERLPPLGGHLPVRRRFLTEFDPRGHLRNLRYNLLPATSDRRLLHRRSYVINMDPSKIKAGHRPELAPEEEVREECGRLEKVKRAAQALKLKEVLSRVNSFIGSQSLGDRVFTTDSLTPDELLMVRILEDDLTRASRKIHSSRSYDRTDVKPTEDGSFVRCHSRHTFHG